MRLSALKLLFAACLLGGPADDPKPLPITVLTYNIQHGRGADRRVDLKRIASIIRREKPTVVAVQEVDRKTKRSRGVDQAAELSRLTGMKVIFGKARDYGGGEYGVAILTRLPVVASTCHALPGEKGAEPRCVLEARLLLPDGPLPGGNRELLFLAAHLDVAEDPAGRLQQVKKIEELLEKRGDSPAILAGDLNDTPESPTLKELGKGWTDTMKESPAPTFPAGRPTKKIDYILIRPAKLWRVKKTWVVNESRGSDHRPLTAKLELVPAEAKGAP